MRRAPPHIRSHPASVMTDFSAFYAEHAERVLGQEFERVLESGHERPKVRYPFARRLPPTLALGIASLLVAATAAGAATGVLDVGSVIPGGEPSGPPENRLPVEQTILAKGTAPVAGPWEITTYKGQGIVVDGETLEQAGSSCIRLVLSDPPVGAPFAASGFCGESGGGGFDISDVPVRDRSGHVEVLLFGHAPEDAAHVELTGDPGTQIRVDTVDGPDRVVGDVWEMTVPPDLPNAHVDWVHQDGTRARADLDVTPWLDRGKGLAKGEWGVRPGLPPGPGQ